MLLNNQNDFKRILEPTIDGFAYGLFEKRFPETWIDHHGIQKLGNQWHAGSDNKRGYVRNGLLQVLRKARKRFDSVVSKILHSLVVQHIFI